MGENKTLGIDGHMVFEGATEIRKAAQSSAIGRPAKCGSRLWITLRRR
jgi:hypothetical protein